MDPLCVAFGRSLLSSAACWVMTLSLKPGCSEEFFVGLPEYLEHEAGEKNSNPSLSRITISEHIFKHSYMETKMFFLQSWVENSVTGVLTNADH